MLTEDDLALVRRDQALPGLVQLLDESAVLQHLREANPGVALQAAQLRYLRYKPGTNCLATYVVRGGDGRTVLVSGKTWRLDAPEKLAKGARAMGVGQEWRGYRDEQRAFALGVFPWDGKLKALIHWATPEGRRHFFESRRSLHELAGADGWTVLNYKPERRMVGRVENSEGRPVAVVKVHGGDNFTAAYAAAKVVRPGRLFNLPRLIGRSRGNSTIVLAWQDGEGLEQFMGCVHRGEDAVHRAGAALAEFHTQSAEGLPHLTLDHLSHRLHEQSRMLQWLMPCAASMIRSLAARLEAVVLSAPAGMRLVHGDFYAKQILAHEGGLGFLDLDAASIGPAWVDLATFLAHLEMDRLRGRVDSARVESLTRAFVEGYAPQCLEAPPQVLRALVAAELFCQVTHLFRGRHPDWSGVMAHALERVAALCDGRPETQGFRVPAASRATRERPIDTRGLSDRGVAQRDEALPFLSTLLDADEMTVRLRTLGTRSAQELIGSRLTEARLLRHKPGRRVLVEYRFVSESTQQQTIWLGKATRRRGSQRVRETVEALRACGLREGSDVAIPEPMGGIDELHLQLQRRVSGARLWPELLNPQGPEWGRRCAAAIARVHSSGVVIPRHHGVDDEVAILETRLGSLARTHVGAGARVNAVLVACRELAQSCAVTEARLIHRDFYPDQILLDGARLWLVDFDLCAMGDPCLDHGNFLAHIVEGSLRSFGQPDALDAVERAYRDVVLAELGAAMEPRLDAWFLLSLARHLHLCTEYADRRAWFPRLLETWERRWARATAVSR